VKKLAVYVQIAAIALAGCSTASKDITPTAVSPMQYQSYDCDQIAAEQRRIHVRVSELGGRLDQAASNDQAIGWVGGLLFWPALFWLGGTKQQEAEYARLRGEYEALHQAAIQKRCAAAMAPIQQAGPAPATTANTPTPAAATSQPSVVLTPTAAAAAEAVPQAALLTGSTVHTSTASVAASRPPVGALWSYRFEDTLYRNGHAFNVRLAAASGSLFSESFEVDSRGSDPALLDANIPSFTNRILGPGRRFTELAPYMLGETQSRWPNLAVAPAGYPSEGGDEPFKTRVIRIVEDNVMVPAGSFKTVRVEVVGERNVHGFGTSIELVVARFHYTVWYASDIHRYVMAKHQQWNRRGSEISNESIQLLGYTAK
jgi:hypothetical protein